MQRMLASLLFLCLPLAAQSYKMAVIGLVHSHVWGHLPAIAKSQEVKLVGVYETNADLVAEAKKVVAPGVPFYTDYKKLLDEQRPDLIW